MSNPLTAVHDYIRFIIIFLSEIQYQLLNTLKLKHK